MLLMDSLAFNISEKKLKGTEVTVLKVNCKSSPLEEYVEQIIFFTDTSTLILLSSEMYH